MTFKDYFSTQANDYSRYRPSYPENLYEYLKTLCPQHELAWDCATGNGQAAVGLAPYFDRVIATDGSQQQINQAIPGKNIQYKVATAEHSSLENKSVDLITVAQALHWFNLDLFYEEVRRVAKPTAIIAVWCYPLVECFDKKFQTMLEEFYKTTLGPYWPPERIHCDTGYRDLAFPFSDVKTSEFFKEYTWTIEMFAGYLSTWSAVQRYKQENNKDPVIDFLSSVKNELQPKTHYNFRFRFILRAGKV